MSQLRKVLSSAGSNHVAILTRPPGYVLEVPRECIDSSRFQDLSSQGETLCAAAISRKPPWVLGEALDVFSGDLPADLREEPFADGLAVRLEEERLAALSTGWRRTSSSVATPPSWVKLKR